MALRDPQTRSLTLSGIPLAELVRDPAIGTPSYVYDLDAIGREARELRAAFEDAPHLVAYAVKANTAAPILRTLAAEGCGADVVSAAELAVVLGCGIAPSAVVYSGVAKRDDEIDFALTAGGVGIGALSLESIEEASRVAARARALGLRARVSLRLNPGVDIDALDTHAHIATGHDEAKFGIPREDVMRAMSVVRGARELDLVGLTVHTGSQFTSTQAYLEAASFVFRAARDLRASGATSLRFVDTGGGFGIDYGKGCPVRPADFVRAARGLQRESGLEDLALYVEPGRSLVAAHGLLLARVIQTKVSSARRWLMIDAGMNDLLRPALYQALHRIVPLEGEASATVAWRVVGPVCESSDDFGEHELPAEGTSAVAILDAGAYGFTMASQYNGRALPTEVFLREGRVVAKTERPTADAWIRERLSVAGC